MSSSLWQNIELCQASFCAIAADHPLTEEISRGNQEIAAFVEECRQLGTSEEAIQTAERRGIDTGFAAGELVGTPGVLSVGTVPNEGKGIHGVVDEVASHLFGST